MKEALTRQSSQGLAAFGFNLGLGVVFAILLTAPAVYLFDTHIVGYPHDGFAQIWKMWWWRKALFELGTSPADMSYINYPYPGRNPHLVASPLIPLMAQPFFGWLGGLRTYNLLMLASFALSWPSAALLCARFSRNRWAATVGGAVYAFYTNKVAHAVGGHLPQMFVFLFPLSAYYLHRVWQAPERRRHAVLAGTLIGLSALVDLKHIALFVAPLLVLFLLFYGIVERRRWNRARVISLAMTFLTAALVTVPFLLPLIIDRATGRLDHFYATGIVRNSADLTSFLVPPPEHPIYGRVEPLAAYSAKLAADGWHENIFYLGVMAVILSLVAWWRYRRDPDVRFWALVALAGMALALGPLLRVGGQPVECQVLGYTIHIPMPYYLLQQVPFYDWGRTPGRIIGMTMLALSVLSSLGSAVILTRLCGRCQVLSALGMILLILLDTIFVWPWPMGRAEVPEFYHQVALDTEDYAILDLPLWEYRCERYQLYYATVHNHRIVGGLVTRRPPEAETAMQAVERLVLPSATTLPAEPLAELGIRYVILHKLCLDEENLEAETAFLEQLSDPIYDDPWIRAFEVPGNPVVSAD